MQMHIDETAFCGRCYTRRCVGMQTGYERLMNVVERKMVLSLSMDEFIHVELAEA